MPVTVSRLPDPLIATLLASVRVAPAFIVSFRNVVVVLPPSDWVIPAKTTFAPVPPVV